MNLVDYISELGLSLYRQSTLMWDNLGIHINTADLPTAETHKAANRVYYGTHWLSRIYCQRLRPRLQPRKHAELKAAWQQAQHEHQQAFMLAVLEKGTEAARAMRDEPEQRQAGGE